MSMHIFAKSFCRTAPAVAVLLVLTSTSLVLAQSMEIGDRVRVHVSSGDRYTGNVTAIDTESLQLDLSPGASLELVDVDKADLDGLEISRGRSRKTLAGLGLGIVFGAGTGALIAHAETNDDGCFDEATNGDCVKMGAVAGAVVGGVLGALIGTIIRTDRWEVVSVGDVGFRIGPGRHGEMAAVVIRL